MGPASTHNPTILPGKIAPHTYTRFLPYAALAILAGGAAQPLAHDWPPCTDDAAYHMYKAIELGSLVELGHWFPRWAPHMAHGYGYPFFNFYAPLASYGVVLLHVIGLAYPAALLAAFTLGLWLAGIGAFLLVRELAGEAAGLAAGAAYLFAPYLAYDVLFRGNLAESFAFVWPPLVLWGIARLARQAEQTLPDGPRTKRPIRTTHHALAVSIILPYAALILTHNIFALIASPLFAGYVAVTTWQARSWRVARRGLLALTMGAALTAYFWAPALAERDLVHADRLLVPPILTWYTNFISPAELLAPPHPEDPSFINPSPARGVGLLPVLMCLPALAAGLIVLSRTLLPNQTLRVFTTLRVSPPDTPTPHASYIHTLYFSAGLLGYGALTLPVSTPIWRLITPLALVQFPWRMLGPAAICAAALIGISVAEMTRWLTSVSATRWLRSVPLAAAVGVLYFGNLGWWYPRYCPPPSAPASVGGLVQFEIDTHTIGTTAKAEYIPRPADGVPDDLTLAEAIQRGEEPSRLSLPAGAAVTSATTRDPLDARYQITSGQPVTATYRQFYYPGWAVTIDGQSVPAAPEANTGLILFQLPAGTHEVRVRFGSTPLRNMAIAVSLVTLAGVVGAGLIRLIRKKRIGPLAEQQPLPLNRSVEQLPVTNYQLLLFFALLPILRLGLIDRTQNPLRHSLPPGGQLGQQALGLDFAGGIRLFGYDLSRDQLPADGAFDVALYLANTTPSDRRYWPSFDIEDDLGTAWQDPGFLPPRWQREPPYTSLWPLDQHAQWARHISLLSGTPPGTYTLYGKVFDLDSQQIASVLDSAGNAAAPRFVLGKLNVSRPSQPFTVQPPKPVRHGFGPIVLLGYDLDRATANAGDSLRLRLYWRSQASTSLNETAQISLVGADGTASFKTGVEPVSGLPSSQWQPGDEWLGQTRLRLPAGLPEGNYTMTVTLSGAGTDAASLGTVHVSAPVRNFQRPATAVRSGAEFSGVAVLEGATVTRSAASLSVILVWRATATPDTAYAVFVHLQGADGRVWAQSDAEPANWSRPTTGWLAGEYVTDPHELSLPANMPPGTYTLWAGMYEAAGGARVPVTGPGAAPDQRVAVGQMTFQ